MTLGSVADHYDDLDVFYREVWGEHIHHGIWRTGRESVQIAIRQLIDYVAEKAEVYPGAHVVDIGAGYGGTARVLANERRVRVTALTVSPAQLSYARAITGDTANPRVLLRDWLKNGLPDDCADVALAIESTEHMPDKALAFSEIRRVLRPGGRAVICAWIAGEARPWHVRHLLEPICREGRLAGLGTEEDYQTLIERAGLESVYVEDLTDFVKRTWRCGSGRVVAKLLLERRYRAYALDPQSRHRVFLVTILRVWAAYALGAMRYLVFVADRPARKASFARRRRG